ncbi:dihydrofolate reductase family protein [Arachidicoccus rhizosphaerae]|nr:dihydrofolate reductase family protein [Arachidicoccus rhizosphaerae]
MRKLMMKMSISVDGFVSGEDGKMDWVFKSSDEESRAWAVGVSAEAGLIIMGRKSFHAMAPYWPSATGPFAAPMNAIPKGVFTQKGYDPTSSIADKDKNLPAAASWLETRVFNGDLAEEIKALKAGEGKPIVAIGGAEFMRNLIATGLVDEYQLAVHPVFLGKGLPILNGITEAMDVKLIEARSFPGGIVVHTYVPESKQA